MAKKILFGTVVSDKMMNTAVVEVERHTVHPLYKKRLKVTKKYSVDTREVPVTIGDFVKIEETVPMSKTKHFKVIEKIAEDIMLKMQGEEASTPDKEEKKDDVVEAKKEVKETKKTRAKKGEKASK